MADAQPGGPGRSLDEQLVSTGGRLAFLAMLAAIAFAVYEPALPGPFFSDDEHYVSGNEWVRELSAANVAAIVDPTSIVSTAVDNYAPVHLLLHGLAWQAFGERVTGHHALNVALHAFAAWALFAFFLHAGIRPTLAAGGAVLFVVHPANVEAVAWISQLKSSAGLLLSLLALLAHPRRPGLALLCFALALLAKPQAAYALPVVALLGLCRGDTSEAGSDWAWRWLAGWAVVFIAYGVVETIAFAGTGGTVPALYDDSLTRLRGMFAVALRYVAMFATGTGLSLFHEPAPPGATDPWWLVSLPVMGLLGWRLAATLRARRVEGVFWAWALVSFAPLSGIVPLPYPMADRYLYFAMPGLLGASILGAQAAVARLAFRPERTRAAATALVSGALALGVLFGFQTRARAHLWRTPERLTARAALRYPDGVIAQLFAARAAAYDGDAARTAAVLRRAMVRGWNRLDHLAADPVYTKVWRAPEFQALIRELAAAQLEGLERIPSPSQAELASMAFAHTVRGETAAAVEALERAIEVGGPMDERLADDLLGLRARLLREKAARPTGETSEAP